MNYENCLVADVMQYDMDTLEILNYYRNLYYTEDSYTERGLMARVINDLLTKYNIEVN